MSYDIGTHVDLTYLNRKVEAIGEKKSFQETASNLVDVGTQIVFKINAQGFKAARRIPVVYA